MDRLKTTSKRFSWWASAQSVKYGLHRLVAAFSADRINFVLQRFKMEKNYAVAPVAGACYPRKNW